MNQKRQPGSSSDPALSQDGTMLAGAWLRLPSPVAPDDEDGDLLDALLHQFDYAFVLQRARRTLKDCSAYIIEEIAGDVNARLYKHLCEVPVDRLPAYIDRMIRNRFIDMTRTPEHRNEPVRLQHATGEQNVLDWNGVVAEGEGLRNPEVEYERKEQRHTLYQFLAAGIEQTGLSPKKEQAAAWYLLEALDDPLLFKEYLRAHHIDIPAVQPGDKAAIHLLEANFAHARAPLAQTLGIDVSFFRQLRRRSFAINS